MELVEDLSSKINNNKSSYINFFAIKVNIF